MTDVDDLLQKTSRTFALTTHQPQDHPTLIQGTVRRRAARDGEVTSRRIEAIRDFLPLLDASDPEGAQRFADRCSADPPVGHAGYLELLREIPFVLRQLDDLSELSRHVVRAHVRRAAEGMAPPVVLVHGWGGSFDSTWQLNGFTELLRDAGRAIIGVDLLGHGNAPKPHDPAEYAGSLRPRPWLPVVPRHGRP